MRPSSGAAWITVAVAGAILALLGVALWFEIATDEQPQDASAEGIELSELLARPERYDGRSLTVVAPVGAMLEQNAFVLGASDPAEGLLVVAEDGVEGLGEVEEGEVVRATGDVEVLTPGVTDEFADLERDVGFDIPDELAGDPILVASVVEAEAA